MCNEIAIKVQTSPGDEIICGRSSHIINFEGGAPSAMSGVMIHPLDGKYGQFTEEDVRKALRPESRYTPISRMLCAEQTANLGGGAVWQLAKLDSVAQVAKKFRPFNAFRWCASVKCVRKNWHFSGALLT